MLTTARISKTIGVVSRLRPTFPAPRLDGRKAATVGTWDCAMLTIASG